MGVSRSAGLTIGRCWAGLMKSRTTRRDADTLSETRIGSSSMHKPLKQNFNICTSPPSSEARFSGGIREDESHRRCMRAMYIYLMKSAMKNRVKLCICDNF